VPEGGAFLPAAGGSFRENPARIHDGAGAPTPFVQLGRGFFAGREEKQILRFAQDDMPFCGWHALLRMT